MKTIKIQICLILSLVSLLYSPIQVSAQERTPLEEFVEGFPIEVAQKAISASFATWLMGGDEAAYFQMRTSEILPTAVIPRRIPTMELEEQLMPEIGAIKANTFNFGRITLNEFLARPDSYSQAYIVVYKGKIVYESYPRMRPSDTHAWMSNAKPSAALVVELLISEGKIDENAPMSDYIKEFKGTAWDNVSVVNTLNMDSGLDIDDTHETRHDPNSHATRLYLAEFGQLYKGKQEHLMDVIAGAEMGEGPGKKFVYASAHTQALVFLVEAVTGERWHQVFDRMVWSKIGAEGAFQVQTTPDGVSLAHGVVGSRLRDMARFGMLYTPSWDKIAIEQVVSDEILKRIHDGVMPKEFLMAGDDGPVFANWLDEGEDPSFLGNSRQWDVVWPDGDMCKFGMQTQGIYVSPSKDLVIGYFSTNVPDHSLHRWMRTIATSGLFDQ